MKTIIFSDIDGTLINQDLKVTPKTRAAIRRQMAAGNLFVPVSARMPQAIKTVSSQITPACPLVAYNGALVLAQDGQTIASHYMSSKAAAQICAEVEKQQTSAVWNVYSNNHWFSEDRSNSFIQNEEKIVAVQSKQASIKQVAAFPGVHKVLVMGKPADLDPLKGKLTAQYPYLFLVKSAPHLLEIMAKGVSKSGGVKTMAKHFKVNLADCWAFGDNYNDEDMLKEVGHAYLMGNGPKDLQKRIGHVTLDNNHDGIAAVLDR